MVLGLFNCDPIYLLSAKPRHSPVSVVLSSPFAAGTLVCRPAFSLLRMDPALDIGVYGAVHFCP
jgi:hypothetical protein